MLKLNYDLKKYYSTVLSVYEIKKIYSKVSANYKHGIHR